MKIKTFGARCPTCQIDRIEDGFSFLGHEVIEDNSEPDLIYSNNRWHTEAIETKEQYPNAKLILNVLDIPEHVIQHFESDRLQVELRKADAVTCISFFVKDQIKRFVNMDARVIYNPMKDVHKTDVKKDIPFLYVGRANDPNKRFSAIFQIFQYMGITEENLVVVGTDNPLFGKYMGVVSDEELNNIYNRSHFVFLPSRIEGIGLSMIEGVMCDCIPVVSKDNLTAVEFVPELVMEPDIPTIARTIVSYWENKPMDLINKYKKDFKVRFHKNTVAKNIIEIYNNC